MFGKAVRPSWDGSTGDLCTTTESHPFDLSTPNELYAQSPGRSIGQLILCDGKSYRHPRYSLSGNDQSQRRPDGSTAFLNGRPMEILYVVSRHRLFDLIVHKLKNLISDKDLISLFSSYLS